MASYKLINISTGIVENILEWDGVTSFDSGSDYILEEITGSFEWSGSIDRKKAIQSYAGFFAGEFAGTANAEITGSLYGSSSYALTASYALNGGAGNGLTNTGSFTGSFTGSLYGTSSYANTASFVPSIKSGTSPSSSATQNIGGEYIYNISFGTNYLTNNYAVNITATSDLRIWTIENKTMSGFRINSNSTVATTGDVYWVAIPYNS